MPRINDWFTLREGQLIKEACKQKHITQEALAGYMNVEPRTIYNWISGSNSPNLSQMRVLATYLAIPLEEFGLASHTHFTLKTAQEHLSKAKSFLDDGEFTSAYSAGNILMSNLIDV